MVLCSNATSILEISFGVNAVFGVLLMRLENMKSQLTDIAVEAFNSIDSTFNPIDNERRYFEGWITRGLVAYKIAKYIFWFPAIISLFFMINSVFILYRFAILGDNCVIPDNWMFFISFFSVFLAPSIYAFQDKCFSYLLQFVKHKTFDDYNKNAHNFEIYKLCWDGQATLKHADKLHREFVEYQLARDIDKIRKRIKSLRHPFLTISNVYKTWRTNKKVTKLLEKYETEKRKNM